MNKLYDAICDNCGHKDEMWAESMDDRVECPQCKEVQFHGYPSWCGKKKILGASAGKTRNGTKWEISGWGRVDNDGSYHEKGKDISKMRGD